MYQNVLILPYCYYWHALKALLRKNSFYFFLFDNYKFHHLLGYHAIGINSFAYLFFSALCTFSNLLRQAKSLSILFIYCRDHQIQKFLIILRYFSFEPRFKLRLYRARDLLGLQILVTTWGFELRISWIQCRYLNQ